MTSQPLNLVPGALIVAAARAGYCVQPTYGPQGVGGPDVLTWTAQAPEPGGVFALMAYGYANAHASADSAWAACAAHLGEQLEIRRRRPSTTQGEVSLFYAGRPLASYGDTITMQPGGAYEGLPDSYWLNIAARDLTAAMAPPTPPELPARALGWILAEAVQVEDDRLQNLTRADALAEFDDWADVLRWARAVGLPDDATAEIDGALPIRADIAERDA